MSLQIILKKLPSTTRLVAVSKLQSQEKIKDLYQQGQRIFAENYAQEFNEKFEALKALSIEWHYVGHLQKNKVKFVAGKAELIHSVDSLSLAQALQKFCQEKKIQQKILLQLNLAQEATKGGFQEQDLEKILTELRSLPNLKVVGLMTMPPLSGDPQVVRPYFKKLKALQTRYQKNFSDLKELSMGTSSDYQIAIEEGATLIRLGTVLFGARPQKDFHSN